MRSDRVATLYLFRPLTSLLQGRQIAIPILMYHRVPDVDDCAKHPYYCTSTAARVFEQQMQFLRESGYRSVSIGDAFRAAQNSIPDATKKLVAITFDDGYRDFYTNAFPILSRYGYSATVFLPTAHIGDSTRRFKQSDCLTWSEVRELREAGVEFGSHTVTHPQLRQVSHNQLREEVCVSKQQIEQRLGEQIGTFSYPYAFPEADKDFASRLRRVLEESGYQESVSTIIGCVRRSADPLCLKRLPVNSHDDRRFFRAKLEGCYDWLHAIQYGAKAAVRRSQV